MSFIFRCFSKYKLLEDVEIKEKKEENKNTKNNSNVNYVLAYNYSKNFGQPQILSGKIKINTGNYELKYDGHYELYNSDNQNTFYVFINGRGTMVFPNNSQYIGYWKHSKPNGYGQYISQNNDVFFGEWNGYNIKERCKILYNNNAKYDGSVTVKQKSVVEMEILKCGFGKYDLPNDDFYQGEFKNDLFNGKGKYISIEGTIYICEFIDGKKNGKGKIIYDKKNLEETLYWKNDKICDKFDFLC